MNCLFYSGECDICCENEIWNCSTMMHYPLLIKMQKALHPATIPTTTDVLTSNIFNIPAIAFPGFMQLSIIYYDFWIKGSNFGKQNRTLYSTYILSNGAFAFFETYKLSHHGFVSCLMFDPI